MIRMPFHVKNMAAESKPAASEPHSPDLQEQLLFLLRAGLWDLSKMLQGKEVDYTITKPKPKPKTDTFFDTDDFWIGLFHVAVLEGLAMAGLFWGVSEFEDIFQRCIRAKALMAKSEEDFQKMRRSHESRFDKLEKERKSAAAYLKKHKIMAQLVRMVPWKKPQFYF